MEVRNIICLLMLITLSACGGDDAASPAKPEAKALTAATLGEQKVLSVAEYLASPPYQAADPARGQQQAQLCRACHTLEPVGVNMIGPNLHGFFGARAGSRQGFDYSDALREADFAWTPRALDAWLKAPGSFLPGNKMTFGGVSYEGDRADLIAYLLVATEMDNQ